MKTKATVSVFARWMMQGVDQVYPIDFHELARLQRDGRICVTYHTNVMQRVDGDTQKAAVLFERDIEELEAYGLSIRHFSPHSVNHALFYPSFIKRPLVWTHNRFAPLSGGRYSDGGVYPRLSRGDAGVDLRQFLIERLGLGRRLFILLHPEYYALESRQEVSHYFDKNPWLEEFWQCHVNGRSAEFWNPLRAALEKLR